MLADFYLLSAKEHLIGLEDKRTEPALLYNLVKQKHNDIIYKNYPWRLLVLNNRSIHLAGIVQTNLREYAFYGEQNSCCHDLECSGNC